MEELEDRATLKKEDLAVIKALGLKCQGHITFFAAASTAIIRSIKNRILKG